MTARLFCRTGELAGSEYQIGEEATIGRREQNDVSLPSESVSGRHARIFFDDEADCYVLEDLDSSDGTQLDDTEVVEPVPLKDLHVITFAEKVDFIFQVVSEEVASSSQEEEGKTQFGMAPQSPADLSDEEEPEGERTQFGGAPGTLPDLSGEESTSEKGEETASEEEDRTRFGEAPPELPDLSEENEPEGDRTRFGEAPGTLPDLSEEEESSEKEEETASEEEDRTRFGEVAPELPDVSEEEDAEDDRTQFGGAPGELPDLPEEEGTSETEEPSQREEEEHTQFGESPPEVPDLSEEEEEEDEQTRFGEAPGPLPDLPDEDAASEQKEEGSSADEDQTRFGEAPGAVPDLPEDEPTSEEEETAEEVPPSEAPTRHVPTQGPEPEEASPTYSLEVIHKDGPQETHTLSEGRVTIGRSPDCDVQIEDPGVSREHAQLIVESDKVVVEDMGSKNFTFVDEERLSGPTTISPGSEIQFGLQVKAVLRRTSS